MYAALDAQEEVWPMSKWEKAAAAMDAALYVPIKDGEITTNTTTEEEEEEEVSTTIDHEFYTTCDRTDEASDTTMTTTTIEDEITTSTITDIPNIMENTITVHDTLPTTFPPSTPLLTMHFPIPPYAPPTLPTQIK